MTGSKISAVGDPPGRLPSLERLLRPAWSLRVGDSQSSAGAERGVVCRQGEGSPIWLKNGSWQLFARAAGENDVGRGETLASFQRPDGTEVHAIVDGATGNVVVPFSFEEAYTAYVSESWREGRPRRGLSARQLAAFYRAKALVPRRLQLMARRRLIQRQGLPDFPSWPSDTSVSSLVRFYAACQLRAAGRRDETFLWFWPEGYHAGVILTHDVENETGIRLALELADVEEQHGFRSSFNFGAWYDIDPGILRELADRGFEIGMHGLTHDRELFASREGFEERLPQLAALASRLGAVGFRSPATHRVFDWLSELPVEYDCTIPNSDPYEPQPGGCCSLWPFFIGDVVELPYTLPQDHTMITLLGHRSPALWLEQARLIENEYGLIQCVSHPDIGYLGDRDNRTIYDEFLRGLKERTKLWRALPREVASWWRQRSEADLEGMDLRFGTVRLGSDAEFASFEPPA